MRVVSLADGAVETAPSDVRARVYPPARVWVLAASVPAVAYVLFGSSGRDDAYITYWEAAQLVRTGRLTNYDGRALEQSSSLLHVLVLALIGWVTHASLPSVGPIVGLVAGALCVPVAYRLGDRLRPGSGWPAALLVATLPPLLYWTTGGLETSLAVLCVLGMAAAAVATIDRRATRPGLAIAVIAVVLVRPETGLVVAVAGATTALFVRRARPADARRMMAVAGVTSATLASVALFRRAYFGAWFPRPVTVKTGHADLSGGFGYVVHTLAQSGLWVAVVVGVMAALWSVRRRPSTGSLFVGLTASIGIAAVVIPGGDWMECGRLLAPWLALAVVLVATRINRVAGVLRTGLLVVTVAANMLGTINYAAHSSTGTALWDQISWRDASGQLPSLATSASNAWERNNAVHARDVPFVAIADPVFDTLTRAVAPRQLVYASAQAGLVVYYLQLDAMRHGRPFDFVDIDGLTDDRWDRCRAHERPTTRGRPARLALVLAGLCGPVPDVVTGIGRFKGTIASAFELVFEEHGFITRSGWPAGATIDANEWIAIRRDLVSKYRALAHA